MAHTWLASGCYCDHDSIELVAPTCALNVTADPILSSTMTAMRIVDHLDYGRLEAAKSNAQDHETIDHTLETRISLQRSPTSQQAP
ncbi:hypothetical protein BST61_g1504 [Cercospora zeina]